MCGVAGVNKGWEVSRRSGTSFRRADWGRGEFGFGGEDIKQPGHGQAYVLTVLSCSVRCPRSMPTAAKAR